MKILLYLIFGMTYLQGLILMAGFPDFYLKLSVEIAIFLLFLTSLRWLQIPDKFSLSLLILYFFIVIISGFVNDKPAIISYQYLRYTLYGYLIFIVVWCAPISLKDVLKINRFIIILFLIQIAASVVKLFIFKGTWEGIVGTTSISGGAHATTMPLFAILFGLSFFLYYWRSIYIFLLSLSFLIIGYASNKRGIWLYAPPLAILEYYLFLFRERQLFKFSHVARMTVISVVILVISISGYLKIMEKSTENTGFKPDLAYSLAYSRDYSEGVDYRGMATGRISSSRHTYNALQNYGMKTNLVGWGPGSTMGTGSQFDPLDIAYGIVGWARDVINIGWLGMIVLVLFYCRLWILVKRQSLMEDDPYWQAFSFGTFMTYFVFAIDHFSYGTVFTESGLLNYVLMYATALVLSPYHQANRQEELMSSELYTTDLPASYPQE